MLRRVLALCLALAVVVAPASVPAQSSLVSPAGLALLGAGLDPVVAAYRKCAPQPLDGRHLGAINGLVRSLKRDGVWPSVRMLYVLANQSSGDALQDLARPCTFGTAVNSPGFTIDQGMSFDGATNYLDGNYIPANDNALSATNVALFSYERISSASTGVSIGSTTATSTALYLRPMVPGSVAGAALASNVRNTVATVASNVGMTLATRSGSTFRIDRNGAFLDNLSPTIPNGLLPAASLWIGGQNSSGALALPLSTEISVAGVATGLTQTQSAALYADVQAYMTAIGKQV